MNINLSKVLKHMTWLFLGLCSASFMVYRFYQPKSVGVKEFPLKLAWSKKLNDNVKEASITDDRILARSSYSISALNKFDGTLLWKHILDERTTSITGRNGNVYLVTEKSLYAFDEATGEMRWKNSLEQNTGGYVSADGKLVHISNKHIVVHFISTEYRIYTAISGDYVTSVPAERGEREACITDTAIHTFDDYPASYELSGGKLLWEDQSTQKIWYYTCANDTVYFSQDGTDVTAYDLEKQSVIWNRKLAMNGFDGFPKFDIQDDYLLISDVHRLYVIDKQNGVLLKTITEKERPVDPQLMNDELFVFFGFDRTIYSYDSETWENLGILRTSPPVAIYAGTKTLYLDDEILILLKDQRIFSYK